MLTDSPLLGQGWFQVGKITVVIFSFFYQKKQLWCRCVDGTGKNNPKGLEYYNNLIDELTYKVSLSIWKTQYIAVTANSARKGTEAIGIRSGRERTNRTPANWWRRGRRVDKRSATELPWTVCWTPKGDEVSQSQAKSSLRNCLSLIGSLCYKMKTNS